jgi:hypothetical protein
MAISSDVIFGILGVVLAAMTLGTAALATAISLYRLSIRQQKPILHDHIFELEAIHVTH